MAEFPKHPQYTSNLYNFFVSNVCQAGLYEMQKNYVALLNMPIGLLNRDLVQNSVQAFTRKRQMLGLSDEYPDIAVAYISGGRVANLVMRTLTGYIGLYTEYTPVTTFPSSMEYLIDNATKDGKNLNDATVECLSEILLNGNSHIVVDIDSDNKPKFVFYKNESRINWDPQGSDKDDYRYNQVMFKEVSLEGDIAETQETVTTYIKHHLVDGVYTITKYNESKEVIGSPIVPKYLGRQLNFIPIVSAGSIDNTPDIDPAPLEPIMQIMVAILGMDTELSHFNMMATAPTLVITGINEDELPKIMGPGVALALPQYTSKAYYTAVEAGSLEHMRNKINDAYSEAQEYGASLIGSNKNSAESGEALRLRQQATTVNLRSVVSNMGRAIERALKIVAEWMQESSEVKYEPNKEFSTFTLTAAELQALVQAWQAGSISKTTVLYNVRKSGMLQPGETVEDEIERLKDPDERFVANENSSAGVVQGDKATQTGAQNAN